MKVKSEVETKGKEGKETSMQMLANQQNRACLFASHESSGRRVQRGGLGGGLCKNNLSVWGGEFCK